MGMPLVEEILKTARENGFYCCDAGVWTKQDFIDFSNTLGTVWTPATHALHKESLNDDNVVSWSSKTRFGLSSIPWHADNPWHPDLKFPLRAFYAVSIPDPEDAKLYFLNHTKWFESLDINRQEYLSKCWILTCDRIKSKLKKYRDDEFITPYYSSLVKENPITKQRSLNYGVMAVNSNVFGVTADEGFTADALGYNKEILHPDGAPWTHQEIGELFQEIIDAGHITCHRWKEGQFLLMDNWTALHYKQRTTVENKERLMWRRTIAQPWQAEYVLAE